MVWQRKVTLLKTVLTHFSFSFQTMAQDMTLLWGSSSPPCWRVMIALEEKNLQGYNQKCFSFEKNEHKSAEVMAMNPRGQLPSFKHGDKVVNESYAAIMYLEDQFKSQGNKLVPDSPAEKAMMYQRMMEGNTFYQKIVDALFFMWHVPEAERHDSAIKRNQEALTAELKLWEGYLKASGGCLVGKNFTLADVAIFPNIACLFFTGLCEERYPQLAAYYKCLKERPSIKASCVEKPEEYAMLKDLIKDV
ncbi:glutathione S-transferase A-like [Nelusetta ayraudi]|uniref:glutathione S-transferase A-like n=1 Tax=Nelusetta ayraudi TaxID=303726 RepID=UPI003F71A1EB